MNAPVSAPAIADPAANERFRELAREQGLNPDDPWVGGYVAYEWTHGRHFFEQYAAPLSGKRVLEFGCNVGASGIVLAHLGATVTGVEVDPQFAALASAQAAAYGLSGRIDVHHLPDTSKMPFPDGAFDLIICNSVLEYVALPLLANIQRELARVLAPGGLLLVMGTSNRLAPREVHSGRWLVNYVPRWIDRLAGGAERQRGLSPFRVIAGFPHLEVVDRKDAGAAYLNAKERIGSGGAILSAMRLAGRVLRPFGLTVGMLMPSFAIAFRKP